MRAATRCVEANAVDAIASNPSPAGGGRGQGEGLLASLAGLFIASAALAQGSVPPSYGFDFVTIGAAGNRSMLPSERYYNYNREPWMANVGQVNYEYRISRTEVTTGQWERFAELAWPQVRGTGVARLQDFQGSFFDTNGENGQSPNFVLNTSNGAMPTMPMDMSWRAAAIYCNWLHNGAPTRQQDITADTFARGAYDISTFRRIDTPNGGFFFDQPQRSPGARYWIPNMNEWTKAVYYDPNRYGPGQEGYWLYPNSSQTLPTFGPPGSGAGAGYNVGPYPYPVGSYPGSVTPWGLLDAIGGQREWTETVFDLQLLDGQLASRGHFYRGSNGSAVGTANENDDFMLISSQGYPAGLRIASPMPAPATAGGLLVFIALFGRWRCSM